MPSLKQHTALVVGASRGVGRAIAIELASQGATVGLMARHQQELQETAEMCHAAGGKTVVLPVDVTDENAVNSVFQTFVTQQGNLDILILSQGIAYRKFLVEDTEDYWRKVLTTNLLSCIHLTRLSLPYLLKKNTDQRQRAIIYISSIAGKQVSPMVSAYCASKYGLVGFAHAIFEDVREQGVKVSVLCPGYINTTMVNTSPDLAPEKMIQVDDIAKITSEIIHSAATVCPVEIIIRPQFPVKL